MALKNYYFHENNFWYCEIYNFCNWNYISISYSIMIKRETLYRESFKKIGQALRDGNNNNFCIENQDSDPFHTYMLESDQN